MENYVKCHGKFIVVNNNKFYHLLLHSHYKTINFKPIRLKVSNLKCITTINWSNEKCALLLFDNNKLKLVQDTITNINTDNLSEFTLKDIHMEYNEILRQLKITSVVDSDSENQFKIIRYNLHLTVVHDIYWKKFINCSIKNNSIFLKTFDNCTIRNKLLSNNKVILNLNNEISWSIEYHDLQDMVINNKTFMCEDNYYKNQISIATITDNEIIYRYQTMDFLKCQMINISKERLHKCDININEIKNVWIMRYTPEYLGGQFEEDIDEYHIPYDEDDEPYEHINNVKNKYQIDDLSKDYKNFTMHYVQFIQLTNGYIYYCDFLKDNIVVDKLGIFNLDTKIFQLYYEPNYTVLLVDKMNVY